MLCPVGRAFEQMPPLDACLDSIFVHYSEILLLISSVKARSAERRCLMMISTKEL